MCAVDYFLAAAGGIIAGLCLPLGWDALACWMGLVMLYVTASVD